MSQEEPAYRLCAGLQQAQDECDEAAGALARAHLEGMQGRLGQLSEVLQQLAEVEAMCRQDCQQLAAICPILQKKAEALRHEFRDFFMSQDR